MEKNDSNTANLPQQLPPSALSLETGAEDQRVSKCGERHQGIFEPEVRSSRLTEPTSAPTSTSAGDGKTSTLPPASVASNDKSLIPFEYRGASFRVVLSGREMFIAKDVCGILGYKNASKAVADHCKHPEALSSNESLLLSGQSRGLLIIPESDLYRLIMRSNMPDAERFQDWVCEEVLPSIRKHGAYLTPKTTEELLRDPDLIIGLCQKVKEEQRLRAQSETALIEAQPQKVRK